MGDWHCFMAGLSIGYAIGFLSVANLTGVVLFRELPPFRVQVWGLIPIAIGAFLLWRGGA